MLGLGEQVGGDERRVSGVVGDDQHLGRAGREVAGGARRVPRHLQLGLGDPCVAGPENLVHRRNAPGAIGECRDGLRPAGEDHLLDT